MDKFHRLGIQKKNCVEKKRMSWVPTIVGQGALVPRKQKKLLKVL